MNSSPSKCTDLSEILSEAGVVRFGIADISPVAKEASDAYARWIASGRNASMDYLQRYPELRDNPALLLENARSIISCAIPYPAPRDLPPMAATIAAYAVGTDYHEIVRTQLETVATHIRATLGGQTRVCVDTAPLRERYWATQAGLGFIGRNNHLIIPGLGSCFFLGEILTTAHLPASPRPEPRSCGNCRRCIEACPTRALSDNTAVDARRCLSYLTIEHRGDFPPDTDLHGHLYGCDICAAVCPHNLTAPAISVLPELRPRPALSSLTVEEAADMDQQTFSTLFTHSAIKRTKLAGLRRNARTLLLHPQNNESQS